jgi:hypothetical protein
MMMVLPFLFTLLNLRVLGAPLAAVVTVLITWISAWRVFDRRGGQIISGWPAVTAVSVICACAFLDSLSISSSMIATWVASVVFLLSPVLIDPRPADRVQRIGQPLAIFAIVAAAVARRYGLSEAVRAAIVVVSAWFMAHRIRQIDPEQPVMQAAVRLGVIVLLINLSIPSTPYAVDFRNPAVLFNGAIAAAVITEIGYRIVERYRKRRHVAATPPS